jgi:hypothetical protein
VENSATNKPEWNSQNMHSELSKLPSASEIIEAYNNVGDNIRLLASKIAACLDVNPRFADELVSRGMPADVIRRLERLGRNQIHESLTFNTRPGGIKLMTLPLSEQVVAISEGITVLEPDEQDSRNIPVNDLTHAQCKQVFSNGRVRSLAEQRSYLQEKKAKNPAAQPVDGRVDFKVMGEYVVTNRPGKWPRRLILQWLTEMK